MKSKTYFVSLEKAFVCVIKNGSFFWMGENQSNFQIPKNLNFLIFALALKVDTFDKPAHAPTPRVCVY